MGINMINFGTPPTSGGGFASGMQGLVQGMQVGQQMRNANAQEQRSEEKFDMLQQQFENSEDDRSAEKLRHAYYKFEKGGFLDPTEVNELLATDNRLGGGRFSTNKSTGKKPDGTTDFKLINRYNSEAGEEYKEGQNLLTFHDADGNERYVGKDNFSNGSPKYKTFKDKLDNENALAEVKRAKLQGGDSTEQVAKKLVAIDKKIKDKTATPTDLKVKAIMEADSKISKTSGAGTAGADYEENLNKALKGEIIDDSYVRTKVREQSEGGRTDPKANERATEVAGVKRLYQSKNKLKELLKDDSNSGLIPGIVASIKKQIGDKDFAKMDEKEQLSTLNKAIKDSLIFKSVFKVVADESGMAFSDEEFAKRLRTIIGGNPDTINDQTLQATFGTFVDEKKKDAQANIENMSPVYYGEQLYYQNQLNKVIRDYGSDAPTKETYATKGGKVPLNESIKSTAKKQKDMAMETLTAAKDGLELEPPKDPKKFSELVSPEVMNKVEVVSNTLTKLYGVTAESIKGMITELVKKGDETKVNEVLPMLEKLLATKKAEAQKNYQNGRGGL